jgi:hypothetical protein
MSFFCSSSIYLSQVDFFFSYCCSCIDSLRALLFTWGFNVLSYFLRSLSEEMQVWGNIIILNVLLRPPPFRDFHLLFSDRCLLIDYKQRGDFG